MEWNVFACWSKCISFVRERWYIQWEGWQGNCGRRSEGFNLIRTKLQAASLNVVSLKRQGDWTGWWWKSQFLKRHLSTFFSRTQLSRSTIWKFLERKFGFGDIGISDWYKVIVPVRRMDCAKLSLLGFAQIGELQFDQNHSYHQDFQPPQRPTT